MKRFALAAAFLLALASPPLLAAPDGMSAPQAAEATKAGDIVLMDVRTPDEWAATGIPAGAVPLSLQDPEFGTKFRRLLDAAQGRPIAAICATGSRSGYTAAELDKLEIHAINVAEGMFGSAAGPGWLARGLPVEAVEPDTFEAQLARVGEAGEDSNRTD